MLLRRNAIYGDCRTEQPQLVSDEDMKDVFHDATDHTLRHPHDTEVRFHLIELETNMMKIKF